MASVDCQFTEKQQARGPYSDTRQEQQIWSVVAQWTWLFLFPECVRGTFVWVEQWLWVFWAFAVYQGLVEGFRGRRQGVYTVGRGKVAIKERIQLESMG